MIQPYDGPMEPDWSFFVVNGAFRHQKFGNSKDVRVYAMDHISYMPQGWSDEINLLPKGIRYISPQHFDEIPRSEAFPIRDVIKFFNGIRFWTSTFAYILTAAVYEGFERIILSGAHWPHDSEEYMSHLPSIDFWAGVAMGRGIKLEVYGPCCIAKPYAWESGLYGYETNGHREIVHVALAAAYMFASKFPYQPIVHTDIDALQEAPVEQPCG